MDATHKVDANKLEENFPARLAELRDKSNHSAQDMSLSLGLSRSYINKVENKKTLPSMRLFFLICEYLNVEASDFFDTDNPDPKQIREIIGKLKQLDDNARDHVLKTIDMLAEKEKP